MTLIVTRLVTDSTSHSCITDYSKTILPRNHLSLINHDILKPSSGSSSAIMAPKVYDPNSENEQAPALPSAPLITLTSNIVIQPPLTRRGIGPGVVLFLPDALSLNARKGPQPLDPQPIQKWAEEGFAVAGVTSSATKDSRQDSVIATLKQAIEGLLQLKELDTKDKFAVIVYGDDPFIVDTVLSSDGLAIACLVSYGTSSGISSPNTNLPTLLHLLKKSEAPANSTIHSYTVQSQNFVLPHSAEYDAGNASLAHSRTLVFLRKWLGGPHFDLEAIWDEHCYFEFEVRSVAKTMATMVQEPYVNHIPTMTGGIGRTALTNFYRDHFIFSNPDDSNLQVISRTVGADRIVDEFIFNTTHDRTVDWLMPGVPPTGKKLAIPMMAVVNVRGDRLYNEHIWWDQATALRQAGILPTHVPFLAPDNSSATLRLPVSGVESAHMLLDESNGTSNEMLGDDWGVQK
ncbi:hypothetical protein NP233_g6663 [Leucocoprinus birnbaumii]|uniref:Carboxymethylenebutenolidase n=1 Tax=Leucocoprinus birnbaumii TaxID=56174 RepID=A0AAD5YQQ5_9AGAR|nr:hypothetical protein NP233_g6663 [Leucocoprinus birnbaumii]